MTKQTSAKPLDPTPTVELLETITHGDMADLCDATDAAIEAGGGFGWIELPSREILERFWRGVVTMPARKLFVARLDGVICGTCQLIYPPMNNQAQAHIVQLVSHFIAPWARGHGLASMLVKEAESAALASDFKVINLDVRESLTRAIAMYEKLGYTRIGTHPHYAEVDGEIIRGFYYYKELAVV